MTASKILLLTGGIQPLHVPYPRAECVWKSLWPTWSKRSLDAISSLRIESLVLHNDECLNVNDCYAQVWPVPFSTRVLCIYRNQNRVTDIRILNFVTCVRHWTNNTATMLYCMNYRHTDTANPPKGGHIIAICSIWVDNTIHCRQVWDGRIVITRSFHSGHYHMHMQYIEG